MSFPLDHIIHLSAPGKLRETVDKFEGMGFRVVEGGKHADGLTENALIVLADGVYLELLQFTHPISHYTPGTAEYVSRTGHWWTSMLEGGWIDFSLGDTTTEDDTPMAEMINSRARAVSVDVSYEKGNEGGRIKPDGDELRWLVTFPSPKHLRGGVPFFCKDLTPRDRRVPVENVNNCRIAALTLLTLEQSFSERTAEIAVAVGRQPVFIFRGGRDAVWKLDSPLTSQSIELHLIAASDDESKTWVRSVGGIGVWEVRFSPTSEGNELGEDTSDIGRVSWTPRV